jgi:glucose-1-phosphate cytidylyltransferase
MENFVKVVILAGGKGSRIAEVSDALPKPMIPIWHRPIMWHIMSCYASQGFTDFVIATGFRGDMIRRYFLDFPMINSDFEINLGDGRVTYVNRSSIDWRVTVIDTGLETATGGRLRRLKSYLDDQPFLMTYGDGLANVNVRDLVDFHQNHGKIATMTAVRPPARFGELRLNGNQVVNFEEKPQLQEGWINGGFFVLQHEALSYIDSDDQMFEREPMNKLALGGELMAFRHTGFWQCMDTRRDHDFLQSLDRGNPPWLRR